jgi:hypothetical protein
MMARNDAILSRHVAGYAGERLGNKFMTIKLLGSKVMIVKLSQVPQY